MPRRRGKQSNDADRGRGFYETTSPFETQVGGTAAKPKTFSGLTDETVVSEKKLSKDLSGSTVLGRMQPEQYDNPRGFPGLSIVTCGDEKSKIGRHDTEHSITHHLEGEAKFKGTGR